jgi:hypothetical protein
MIIYKFWTEENGTRWPSLAKLARKHFSAPATSAESERLFSTAGQIITNLGHSLKEEYVEKLLFLHHNLKNLQIQLCLVTFKDIDYA